MSELKLRPPKEKRMNGPGEPGPYNGRTKRRRRRKAAPTKERRGDPPFHPARATGWRRVLGRKGRPPGGRVGCSHLGLD
jgi:hypothetical protein